jgi:hypothetical protein
LPPGTEIISVSIEGSAATRAFRIRFRAPPAEVQTWLSVSPGTAGRRPERLSSRRLRYLISPGGGAQHAEVVVDEDTATVEIYAYWS